MKVAYNGEGKDLAVVRDNNDSSVAWILNCAGVNYYTAGDLEDNERYVSAGLKGDSKLHIIKCGHHGSEKATSADFLNKANPTVAILQGSLGSFPHPTQEVLERLHDANVNVFSTGFYVNHGPKPTVCGGDKYAGDVVVTIWDDGVFSVYYLDADGSPQYKAWKNPRETIELSEAEKSALIETIPLTKLADLSDKPNAALDAAKKKQAQNFLKGAEVPGGPRPEKRGRKEAKSWQCANCKLVMNETPRTCYICDADLCEACYRKGRGICGVC
jgi:hypothetical protein